MDYLALLCTIHGDGPQTLQRLRRRGIRSLGDVVRLAPPDLEAILGRERVDAERFQREALHLRGRVEGPSDGVATLTAPRESAIEGSDAFSSQKEVPAAALPVREASPPEDQVEPEGGPVPPLLDLPAPSQAGEPDLPQAAEGGAEAPGMGAPASPLDALLRVLQGIPGDPAESSSVTQRLMSRSAPQAETVSPADSGPGTPGGAGEEVGREPAGEPVADLDRRETQPGLEVPFGSEPQLFGQEAPSLPESPLPERASATALPPRPSAWEARRPSEASAVAEGTPLETLCSDRVDREMIAQLETRGFQSLEDLVALDARRGAQRAGLAYTQMLRLQFLARRALR